MIRFTIPIEPRTKKNHQRIATTKGGRPFILPSKQYSEYENICGYYIKHKGENISVPVNIKCLFYMRTRRKCDLTNLLEAIDDILVKYKVIADDHYGIVQSHDGSRVYVDKENPRTEIIIEDVRFIEHTENDGKTEAGTG